MSKTNEPISLFLKRTRFDLGRHDGERYLDILLFGPLTLPDL